MKKQFKLEFTWKQKTYILFSTTVVYGLMLYILNSNQNLKEIIIQAIIFGVLMTLFFIFLFPWVMRKIVGESLDNIAPALLEGETLKEEIFANLFRGIEAVGGKLFFTNKRLIFKSHSLNIQKGQTDISFIEIINVEKRKTMKIVDNGMKITTKDGKEYCFIIEDRDLQIEKIKEILSK
ncbi:GRAM domain-containing protein [Polaribacter sp. PL03]|nr:GRAM domain-containing protein [Polaribacter sp. PL03]